MSFYRDSTNESPATLVKDSSRCYRFTMSFNNSEYFATSLFFTIKLKIETKELSIIRVSLG